jgi:hypothetical protein
MDNPWLTDELRAEKDHLKALDLDAYENVWGGRCRSHVENALWKMEIFGANRERAPINNTGLTGRYDVSLQPVPDSQLLQADPADPLAPKRFGSLHSWH